MELSPPAFRTFVVGTSYQLGNLVSSASATIEATIGQQFPLPPKVSGKKITPRYQYGKVICIFLGCVSSPPPFYFLYNLPPFLPSLRESRHLW
jgi:SHS family lactate transporter-like MFS transporter